MNWTCLYLCWEELVVFCELYLVLEVIVLKGTKQKFCLKVHNQELVENDAVNNLSPYFLIVRISLFFLYFIILLSFSTSDCLTVSSVSLAQTKVENQLTCRRICSCSVYLFTASWPWITNKRQWIFPTENGYLEITSK